MFNMFLNIVCKWKFVVCKITCREKITSLFCLPFFFYGQSIREGADWTCVVVGYSSGYIRFYTEVNFFCLVFKNTKWFDVCKFIQTKSAKQN